MRLHFAKGVVVLSTALAALWLGGACSEDSDVGAGATGAGTSVGASGGTGGAPECTVATGCPGDEVCDPTTMSCVGDLDCTTHADCGGGAFCAPGGTCSRNTEGGPCDDTVNCIAPEVCDNNTCGCGGELWGADNVPPNVLIVLDRSSSMDSNIGGGTKWEIAQQAIGDMLATYGGGVRFGLMLYPGTDQEGNEGGQCSPGAVFLDPGATPADINSFLAGAGMTGFGTPIGGALDSLPPYAGLEDTTRGNYVLLITDGEENCDGDAVAAVTALRGETPEVKTFVVGFGDGVDPDQLNAIAQAGGTAQAQEPYYYQCDDATSLSSAFASIAGSVLSCSYALSEVPPDPNLLFVYTDGDPVPRDPTHSSGWDYDEATGQLTFYGTVCDALTAGTVGELLISYGCPPPNIR